MSEVLSQPVLSVIAEPEFQEVVRAIREKEIPNVPVNRRKSGRQPYLRRDIGTKVIQPGGGARSRVVAATDLSVSGMGILYPGYLHKGCVVHLTMQKRLGKVETVTGSVVHCRLINGAWHAAGIKFQEAIAPDVIDISTLKGSVLFIDDGDVDSMLFSAMLDGSAIRVTEATTSEQAVGHFHPSSPATSATQAKPAEQFDLVVCDLNLGLVTGESVMIEIRKRGYAGPILIATAETMPSRLADAMKAGGNGMLRKPYSAEQLHAALAPWLSEGRQIVEESIYSTLCADPRKRLFVEKYVEKVRSIATELRKCIQSDNDAQARLLCQTLKGTGTGYGFSKLTDAATLAITSLDASGSVAESVIEMQRLESICARLTAAEPPRV